MRWNKVMVVALWSLGMNVAHAEFTIEPGLLEPVKKADDTRVVKEVNVTAPAPAQTAGTATTTAVVAKVSVPTPPPVVVAPPKPVCVWEVIPKKSYESAINTWAKCAGWAGVDWQGKEMAPSFRAAFAPAGSFLDALRELKRASGLDITAYEDNKIVLVVVPR